MYEPGDPINALIWVPEVGAPFGGHTIQMEMTAKHLAAVGDVSVRVCRDDHPNWDGIDIVHGQGVTQEHVRRARLQGLPVVLSAIYVSKAYRTGKLEPTSRAATLTGRARKTTALALAAARGKLAQKLVDYDRWAIETAALYEQVDMLLPNSIGEGAQIVRDLSVTTPIRIVPNAVDPTLFNSEAAPADDREGVLYVGRIEPHKNQLRLIEALEGTGIPLTLVGHDHPDHRSYCDWVRAAALRAGNVRHVGPVSHDQLADYYRRAVVHAVPSRFETTGLVSLEAALCGCNIVSTEVGFAREYLGDLAWYCDPLDPSSICRAINQALAAPNTPALRERTLANYTWRHAAESTAAAYRELLVECSSRK